MNYVIIAAIMVTALLLLTVILEGRGDKPASALTMMLTFAWAFILLISFVEWALK